MRGLASIALLAGCYDPRVVGGSPCIVDSQCPHELACIHSTCTLASEVTDGGGTCADVDLGSVLGAVATGTTSGHADTFASCLGRSSPDVSYAWTAPAAGTFTIDLCSGPDPSFDSTLSVRDGSCTGPELACDDDGCDFTVLSKVRVDLAAGQRIVIVVDGSDAQGAYTLTISRN